MIRVATSALALGALLGVLAVASAQPQDDPYAPAIARFEAGDAAGALTVLDGIIKQRPKDGLGRYYRGVVLAKLGRASEVEAEYRAAVKLDAKLAPAWNNLGAWLSAAGKAAEAEKALKTAVAVKADYVEAWYNLALAYRAQKKTAAEVSSWQKVVKLLPQGADPLVQLAGALVAAGDRAGAIAALKTAVKRAPKDAVARFNLGSLQLAAGDAKSAAATLALAASHDPKYVKAWWRLGIARRKLKDLPGSLKALEAGSKLAPADQDVSLDLALTVRAGKDLARARKLLAPLARADFWPAVFYLASLDAEQGKCKDARAGFDRYLAAGGKTASVEAEVQRQLAACKP